MAAEEAVLKDLHREMIREEERHLFYVAKIRRYRQELLPSPSPSPASTPALSKHTTAHEKENLEPTEQELLYFYDPQKEVARYR